MTIFGIVTFPGYFGQHFAGDRLWIESLGDLFQNCTWHMAESVSLNETIAQGYGNCKLENFGVWSNYGRDNPMNVLMIFCVFSVSNYYYSFKLLLVVLWITHSIFVMTKFLKLQLAKISISGFSLLIENRN